MTAPIPDYELELPTAQDLVSALTGTLGEQECRSVLGVAMRELDGTRPAIDELLPTQLLDLCVALSRQRGLGAVIGRSFVIRLRSYMELSTKGAIR
jgi:hypothetical protein